MLKRTIYILLFLAVVASGVFVVLNRNACHTLLDEEPAACEKSSSSKPVAEPTSTADAVDVEMPTDSLPTNK